MASDVDDKNADIKLLKRTRISVLVDEALPDILVVTYEYGVKIFKGVLLDSTKRDLPCGVGNINPVFTTPPPPRAKVDEEEDNLYAANQRFAYLDPAKPKRRNIQLSGATNKLKTSKMTVRLRPRQVLCSKCKDICNENSENVSRKRKLEPITQNNTSSCDNKQIKQKRSNETQAVRKKRTSMEDLGESAVESAVEQPQATRTIKISFGRQGEGTVLKIPTTSTENCNDDDEENMTKTVLPTKAARRALKRAKKEARRKVLLSNSSPLYLGNCSPRYPAMSSPRGVGNSSPRYLNCSYDLQASRRRKHKVKHKKRHKDEKERYKNEKESEEDVGESVEDREKKEQCITQKLSINLKRLNSNLMNTSDLKEGNSSGDEQGDGVPDFPQANAPLVLRMNAHALTSAPGAEGGRLLVGDVVWGKIQGFPWWPGKILTITSCGNQAAQAHVAWYGSSTSSLMQCDQLSHYLDHFKNRYNKKKKGPYKEAIKQASNEARENAENRVRQPLGNSPSHNIIQQVVPPALASPREIDVVS